MGEVRPRADKMTSGEGADSEELACHAVAMAVYLSRVVGALPVTNFFIHCGTTMNLHRDVFALPKHPSLQDKNRCYIGNTQKPQVKVWTLNKTITKSGLETTA